MDGLVITYDEIVEPCDEEIKTAATNFYGKI